MEAMVVRDGHKFFQTANRLQKSLGPKTCASKRDGRITDALRAICVPVCHHCSVPRCSLTGLEGSSTGIRWTLCARVLLGPKAGQHASSASLLPRRSGSTTQGLLTCMEASTP
jgi:hypothetical protein